LHISSNYVDARDRTVWHRFHGSLQCASACSPHGCKAPQSFPTHGLDIDGCDQIAEHTPMPLIVARLLRRLTTISWATPSP
jgi:hypothetical protein